MYNDKKSKIDQMVTYTIEENIFIRKFEGDVSVTDMISSWAYLINNDLIPKHYKGIISDFSKADIRIGKEGYSRLESYCLENKNIIKNLKMAQVMVTSQIVFPVLFTMEHPDISTQAFSSIEAAKSWINE